MLIFGKTTAWLPMKNTPPCGPTVKSTAVLAGPVPTRLNDGRPCGAIIMETGALALDALCCAVGATKVLSEQPAITAMTATLATTTQ